HSASFVSSGNCSPVPDVYTRVGWAAPGSFQSTIRSLAMKEVVFALTIAAVFFVAGPASAEAMWGRTREAAPVGMHAQHDSVAPRAPMPFAHPMREHRPDGHHRHRVTAVIVYVPAVGFVNLPYYYSSLSPAYVEQDPPEDAYREPSGFYYWCPDPSGYYPDVQ